jgi:hypothetical protein
MTMRWKKPSRVKTQYQRYPSKSNPGDYRLRRKENSKEVNF